MHFTVQRVKNAWGGRRHYLLVYRTDGPNVLPQTLRGFFRRFSGRWLFLIPLDHDQCEIVVPGLITAVLFHLFFQHLDKVPG